MEYIPSIYSASLTMWIVRAHWLTSYYPAVHYNLHLWSLIFYCPLHNNHNSKCNKAKISVTQNSSLSRTYHLQELWWWFPEKKVLFQPGYKPGLPCHIGWIFSGYSVYKLHCPLWYQYWWCWTGNCLLHCTPDNLSGIHG